ncbi:MAG: arsenic resistance N-acetyltransferase ArsN2 [Gemmatimonadaceae bacterium]
MDIRRARASDQPAVVALLSDAGLSVPGVAEHFSDFLVAERDDVIVSAVGLELREHDALLRSAVVAPAERGKGIGDDLFHSIVDFARAKGVGALHLLTTGAEAYWAKRGFGVVSRDDIPESVKESAEFKGACPSSAVAMSKGI